MNVDLHCHTRASDGALTPREVVVAAAAAGVDTLAITDHDCVDGVAEATAAAGQVRVIPGIEFSTHFGGGGVHVVGLDVDPGDAGLTAACATQRRARQDRAVWIADRLARRGIADALAGAQRCADGSQIGRPHFARFLVESGHARTEKEAFARLLGRHDHGSSVRFFADMDTVIGWIRAAGGTAVLAHPLKYKLTRTRLDRLVRAFREAGGDAIEVVCGQQHARATAELAALATAHGLAASRGSDFHQPGRPWAALGRVPPLPPDCRPVWSGGKIGVGNTG